MQFLSLMKMNRKWPWRVLWIEEVHFPLQDYINTENDRTCDSENAFQMQWLPLRFAKIHVWCDHGMAAFMVGIFFFEKKVLRVFSPAQSIRYIMHLFCANTLFQHYNRADVCKIHFKTKIVLFRYIATPMKRLLDLHIRNDSIINRYFTHSQYLDLKHSSLKVLFCAFNS